MKLVVGGAFQGKYLYAKKTFGIPDSDFVDGIKCTLNELYTCKGVKHFHEFVRQLLESNYDFTDFVETLYEKNPDVCIICNELGCGVIPAEEFDRRYRETVGRLCEQIAERSDEVHRLICGLGTVIKGA